MANWSHVKSKVVRGLRVAGGQPVLMHDERWYFTSTPGLALCSSRALPTGALFCAKHPFTFPCIRSVIGAQPSPIRHALQQPRRRLKGNMNRMGKEVFCGKRTNSYGHLYCLG
jgi:hypothetical protein